LNIKPGYLKSQPGANVTPTILLVDDKKDRRDSIRAVLNLRGYLTVDATHYENACYRLTPGLYDFVLLTMALPAKNGFRILDFLRKRGIASWVVPTRSRVKSDIGTQIALPQLHAHPPTPCDSHNVLTMIDRFLPEHLHETPHKHIDRRTGPAINARTRESRIRSAKEALAHIAALGDTVHEYSVLIDLRDANSQSSASSILDLTAELTKYCKYLRRRSKRIPPRDEGLDQAKYFDEIIQNRGFKVLPFKVFKNVSDWLSSFS
jgi:CheY-like chemotaxis protein